MGDGYLRQPPLVGLRVSRLGRLQVPPLQGGYVYTAIAFAAGVFIGANLGLFFACLLIAGRSDNE